MSRKVQLPYIYDRGFLEITAEGDPAGHQVFSHQDLEGCWRHFDITKLKSLIEENPTLCRLDECALLKDQVLFVMRNHGIEPEHITKITPADIERPGILADLPDDTSILVDGNHRYVARFLRQDNTMSMWRVPEQVWKRCLVLMPLELTNEDLLAGPRTLAV